nr:ATP-grasp domain-containing protein [Massilia sp. CFBP 13647]
MSHRQGHALARRPANMQHSVSTDKIPAVVFGIDTPIGLTIVRDLGRSGIEVHGIARSAQAIGLASRYLRAGLVREKGEEATIAQLVALNARLGTACLFAISEGDIALLNRHRTRLAGYKIMFADDARMDSVLNKDRTYAAAARVGIRTPRTEQVTGMAQAEALAPSLRFPVVLKWANPLLVVEALGAAGLHLDKTHYCDTPAELLAYLRRFEGVGLYPLIQEYCPGYGLGQFILIKDGQVQYTFQHKRLHEWPPEGGFSSMCESVGRERHAELMDKSVALLRELGWEGVAMVEYRHDPASGESALMEINGRFWGSLPLAYHAGANFPTLCYKVLGLGEQVTNAPYRSGMRCRYMVPETKRLLRVLFGQRHIADKTLVFRRLPTLAGFCVDFLRPGSRYYVFDMRDPKPFFTDIGAMMRKGWQGIRGH